MKLLQVYRAILEYARYGSDETGHIFSELDPKRSQITLNDKDMVLPTDEMLNSTKGRLYFHPFREQVAREIAETTEEYLKRLNIALNGAMATVMIGLLEIVGSPAIHSKIDPGRKELLQAIPGGTGDSSVNISQRLLKEVKKGADASLVRIYIKKGGSKTMEDGTSRKFARLAVVFFPLWEQLESEDCGLNKPDRAVMVSLYKFMFDKINNSEGYNFGSSDNVAPTIAAILNGALGVSSRLDELQKLYKEFSQILEDYAPFKTDWVDAVADINSYDREIARILPLPGSEGTHNRPEDRDKRPDDEPRRESRESRREERRDDRGEKPRDEGRTADGKLRLGFLVATVPEVRNAPNVMDGSIVSEIEEQWERERREAVAYWDRHGRPHPDFGHPDDVDAHYRKKLRDREDRDYGRGRRDDRRWTRDEEIGYEEWCRDADEAEDYYRRYRRPHPDLGHPDDYREFDPRDPNYSRRAIEERYDRRDRRDDRSRGRDDRDYRRDDRDRDRGYYNGDRDYDRRWERRDDRRDDRGYGRRDRGYDDLPAFAR